jgi:hypothetical protein
VDSNGDRVERPLHELDDEALMARIRDMFRRVDAPPAWLVEAAKLSYGLRDVDLELAALVADSEDESAVGVRAAGTTARMLTFDGEDLTIELELHAAGAGPAIIGQLVPPGPAQVDVHQVGGGASVQADDLGRFSVDSLGSGPCRLICRRSGHKPTATPWLLPG